MPSVSGLSDTAKTITRRGNAFARPVPAVNGDHHSLKIAPFLATNHKPVAHVARLQVMGADQVHVVRVQVDTESTGVFSFGSSIVAVIP